MDASWGGGHILRTPFAGSTGISWEKGLWVVGVRAWRERGKPITRPEALRQHSPQNAAREATAFFLLPGPKCSFQSSTFYILSVFKTLSFNQGF